MNKMCRTNAQGGRSMIEMLGVLAIIGVLSVGGIAGYSKAMMKFKINKTIDQITQISQNIRTLYARQKNYGRLNGKVIYKANLAPKEIFEGSGTDYTMTNAFGGRIVIGTNDTMYEYQSSDDKAFIVSYHDIPEEACIELATQDWGSDVSSGLVEVQLNSGGIHAYPESVPISVDVAVDKCNCMGQSTCSIAVSYK